jgi:hypothetical protein
LHQTLKRFLARQSPAQTIQALQESLDRFRDYYNTVRPHRAIGRRTPQEAFGARPKATPSLASLAVPGGFRLRRDKVDITGVVTLRHNSRLHHIGLGRRLIGTRVLVEVVELWLHVGGRGDRLLADAFVRCIPAFLMGGSAHPQSTSNGRLGNPASNNSLISFHSVSPCTAPPYQAATSIVAHGENPYEVVP